VFGRDHTLVSNKLNIMNPSYIFRDVMAFYEESIRRS
jgi:hypothetical protein